MPWPCFSEASHERVQLLVEVSRVSICASVHPCLRRCGALRGEVQRYNGRSRIPCSWFGIRAGQPVK
eukprot:12725912-Alexandrium_andersonii.AAC.1